METRVNSELLKQVEILQAKYPQFIICGSVALFFHGVKLERWRIVKSDLDLIAPYYTLIEGSVEEKKSASASDFDYSVKLNNIKVDIRIDNKAKYEIVKHKEINYKVMPLLEIIEYKTRYALKGNQKHIDDLTEIIFNKK